MLSDIEIAQQNRMEKIQVIADKCGLTPDDIERKFLLMPFAV